MTFDEVPLRESAGSSNSSSQLNVSTTDTQSESSSSGPPAISPKPRRQRLGRIPDMQLGRCPWVRVYDNVTYIVVGMVFREHEGHTQMLLIQEAKKKCRGKWYMPAGHVEPGETIEQAVQREVKEETGFESRVEALLSVEVKGSGWYRMAYWCEITGGELKTVPDVESLSAGWFNIDDIRNGKVDLRGNDFFRIVSEAERYYRWKRENVGTYFEPILNVNQVQPGLFIEFVIVKQGSLSDRTEVLVHTTVESEEQLLDPKHEAFPLVEFGFEYFFPVVVSKCYRHLLGDGQNVVEAPCAVLGTWCWPESMDSIHHGLKLRLLCMHKKSAKNTVIYDERRYHWLEIKDSKLKGSLGLDPRLFRVPLFML
ncbi:unnamed protein product [Bursaphelenchus xylophilus]|uniref:(pine wood nematode) hypothetical protein n=1 Tax=Bursaphelenchus xylophilus TaxID=6326 RepID=A0A1I7S650_BURXY|nr:unnamed protein product [Bursaphelenchus xylophilus]CAG9082252.1 unnamed protein product [Bursaphelenchus xylophilus]